jgi:hypothetical protein
MLVALWPGIIQARCLYAEKVVKVVVLKIVVEIQKK